ncbi:MAG: LysR family transcriptional regulator [Rhizobiales bacterium]|nr:LysR family transcriptional regulator [Hyphomicrobiales bacterium]
MDRIESLTAFVKVAEHTSFAEAARRLNRSPAAVTRAVAELEERLGVRLLNRTTRAVTVTEAGQHFLAGAKRVLTDLEDIEQAAAGQGHVAVGELRLTAPIVFGRLHVLPVVAEFLQNFPSVSVRLFLTDRPTDLVEEGFDVALRIGVLSDLSAIATRIGTVRRTVVAAPSYLASRGTPKRPDDLAAHDLVAFVGLSGSLRWPFRHQSQEIMVAITPRLIVNTAEAAIDAAKSGLGVTRVLSYQARASLADGTLISLLQDFEDEDLPVHLLYPGGRHPPPKLRAFLDFTVPRLRAVLQH